MNEPTQLKQEIQSLIEQLLRRNAEIESFRSLDADSLAAYSQLRRRLRIHAYNLRQLSPNDFHELFQVQYPEILDFNPLPSVMQMLAIEQALRAERRQKEPPFFCNGITFQ